VVAGDLRNCPFTIVISPFPDPLHEALETARYYIRAAVAASLSSINSRAKVVTLMVDKDF
jgi:hypothetical protein